MTMPNPSPDVLPSTQMHQKWTVDGFPGIGYFGTKEGGEVSGDVTKTKDGGSLDDYVIPGPPSTDNVTLTKLYKASVHGPTLRQWAGRVMKLRTTITGYDTDPDLGVLGDPMTYANALLVRVKFPDHDANSSDPGMFELEFAVSELT